MLFCLAQGARSGPRVGVAASLGISTGAIVHILLAGLGLAAILAAHPVAFEALRWAGVGYLVWLAARAFRTQASPESIADACAAGAWRAWRDGALVNLLNPKVAIFVLAFIPQFVNPQKGSTFLQFLIFGSILVVGGTIVNGLVGVYAGKVGHFLTGNERAGKLLQRLSGAVFLGLAAKLAFEKR